MELINFDQICRICWKSNNLRTVFNEDIPSMCEMLMACSPIEVCEENGLPTKLCEDCGLELKTAFTFRTKCISSEIKFKKYLLDHGIETTVQYVHNAETDETIETIHTTVAIKAEHIPLPLINNTNISSIINNSNLNETFETSHNIIQSNENINDSIKDECTAEIKQKNLVKCEENRMVKKKYSCNQCKRSYLHPRNLKRHIKEHHNGNIRKPQTGSRDLRCCICRKIFSFRNALIRHLRVIHHNITQKCFKTVKGKKCCTSQINIFIENIHESTNQEKGIFGDINISDDDLSESGRENTHGNLQNETESKNKENVEINDKIENKVMLDISNEVFLGSVDSILKEHDNVQMFQDENQTVFIVEESLFNKIALVAKNSRKSEDIIDVEDGVEYKCQLCENIFTSLSDLKNHIKISHIIVENEDDLVEKNDLSNEDVEFDDDMNAKLVASENEIEIINENGEKKIKYSCKVCDKSYNAKNNLHRHIKDKHLPKTSEPIRQYKCEMCDREFARKGLLERHRESHLERVAYQCEQCGDVFDQKKKLRLHTIKHETQKKFQCDVCNKWFLRSTTLKVHKKQHASILPFPCPECDRAFSMRPALEAHVRTHSETRPYVCNVCRRAFRHPGHLDTHLKLHTGERPYSCTMCEKRFTTSTHLKYHIKVHLDQRDFKCEICGRAFIHSTELKYHMISHSQIKERPCPICDKLFARTNQVTKHLKQVHHITKNFYAH